MKQVLLKPHNQETYSRLLDMLEKENRVACVQPTGTGKSYIALKYIEEHLDQKILLLAPTDIILNQFNETVEEIFHENPKESIMKNTTTAKYLDLSLNGFQYVFDEKWDVIIMDEFHRTGASIWNKSIDKLINLNSNAKLIGLSATPIRFLDDYRNMGEEVFHGNYACHYNVNDAWKRGILPIPKYVLTDYRITEGTEDYIRQKYPYAKTKERVEWVVKQYLENGGNIHQILKDNLPNKNGKYIVFCSDSAHIQKMRPIVKGWLEPFNSKIHMYTTLSMDDEPDAELLAFKNDDSESLRLLFCVERLNEGLHLCNLDGIFMLRPTTSPIIYLQQMGRVLNAGSTKQPVIFDLVNNFSEYRRTVLRYRDMPEEEIENLSPKERAEYNSYKEGKYDEFLEFDFVQKVSQICDLFDEVDKHIYDQRWYDNFEILKEFINKYQRFPVFDDTFKNFKIGHWCQSQRKRYQLGTLEKDRKEALDKINFVWTPLNKQWNDCCNALSEYIQVYHKEPSRNVVFKNIRIGAWYKNQRRLYRENKLTSSQIENLEKAGMNWNGKIEYTEAMYNLLEDYFKTYGTFPKRNVIYKNKKLGAWFQAQRNRYKNKKLAIKYVNLLESLGYRPFNEVDEVRNYKYKLLIEFNKLYGRNPKSSEIYKNVRIGQFLAQQKYLYKKGKLSDDNVIILNDINAFSLSETQKWKIMYEIYIDFKKNNKREPYNTEHYKGTNLGNWTILQRKKSLEGKLSKEQIDRLNEANFVWDKYQSHWNEMYNLVKEYQENHLNRITDSTKYQGSPIGSFLKGQRKLYREGKLQNEKIDAFKKIGIDFSINLKDKNYDHKLKGLKDFIQKKKRMPKRKESYMGIPVGNFYYYNRNAYKEGVLTKERQKKLEAIGVVFDDNKKEPRK